MNVPIGLSPATRGRSDKSTWLWIILFYGLNAIIAVIFGLVAVTNLVFVGVAGGLLVGTLLLAKPVWNIWLVLILGLLVAGVIPIWFESMGTRAAWGISVLGFTLMFSACFRMVSSQTTRNGTPFFVWLALVFLIYSLTTSIIQLNSLGEVIGGFKRYFQAFGILFALAWLTVSVAYIKRWQALMAFVAVAQLPFALYELFRLVPIRESMRSALPGMVPIDVVAGTFGASLYGGGANAEMATFLIIVLAFLLARMKHGIFRGRVLFLTLPFVLVPLFLGETKVVVILLPLMFFVLYRRELIAKPQIGLTVILVAGVLTTATAYTYVQMKGTTFEQQVSETLRYNVFDRGYGSAYLNRTTSVTFWAEEQGLHDPVSAVFGNGLGAAHDATGGHVSRKYPGYRVGLTGASTLLWELGVVGLLLFMAILAAAWKVAGTIQKTSNDPLIRADASAIQASIALFAFYLVYRTALLETLSFQIIFAAVLGYLAWLYRFVLLRAA